MAGICTLFVIAGMIALAPVALLRAERKDIPAMVRNLLGGGAPRVGPPGPARPTRECRTRHGPHPVACAGGGQVGRNPDLALHVITYENDSHELRVRLAGAPACDPVVIS
jgi:hypothetical protein